MLPKKNQNQKTLKEKFRELIKQRLFKALVLIILASFSFLIQQNIDSIKEVMLLAQVNPPEAVEDLNIPLQIKETLNINRTNEMVHNGIPIAKGDITNNDLPNLIVKNESGKQVPATFEVLSRWAKTQNGITDANDNNYNDNDIQWLLVSFPATVEAGGEKTYSLETGTPTDEIGFEQQISLQDNASEYVINTGPAEFKISKNELSLFKEVSQGGSKIFENNIENGSYSQMGYDSLELVDPSNYDENNTNFDSSNQILFIGTPNDIQRINVIENKTKTADVILDASQKAIIDTLDTENFSNEKEIAEVTVATINHSSAINKLAKANAPTNIKIERQNKNYTVILVEGEYDNTPVGIAPKWVGAPNRAKPLYYRIRYEFFAGSPTAVVYHKFWWGGMRESFDWGRPIQIDKVSLNLPNINGFSGVDVYANETAFYGGVLNSGMASVHQKLRDPFCFDGSTEKTCKESINPHVAEVKHGTQTQTTEFASLPMLINHSSSGDLAVSIDHMQYFEPQSIEVDTNGKAVINVMAEKQKFANYQGTWARVGISALPSGAGYDHADLDKNAKKLNFAPLNNRLLAFPKNDYVVESEVYLEMPYTITESIEDPDGVLGKYKSKLEKVVGNTRIWKEEQENYQGLMTWGSLARTALMNKNYDNETGSGGNWDKVYAGANHSDYHNAWQNINYLFLLNGEPDNLYNLSFMGARRVLHTQIIQIDDYDNPEYKEYMGWAPTGYGNYRKDNNSSHSYFENLFNYYYMTGDREVIDTLKIAAENKSSVTGADRASQQMVAILNFIGHTEDDGYLANFKNVYDFNCSNRIALLSNGDGREYAFVFNRNFSSGSATGQTWMNAQYFMNYLYTLYNEYGDIELGDHNIKISRLFKAVANAYKEYASTVVVDTYSYDSEGNIRYDVEGNPIYRWRAGDGTWSGSWPNSFEEVNYSGNKIGGEIISIVHVGKGSDPVLYPSGKSPIISTIFRAAKMNNDAELLAFANDGVAYVIDRISTSKPLNKATGLEYTRLFNSMAHLSKPALQADFIANLTHAEPNQEIQFTDQSTGNVTSWSWDFNNDGQEDSREQNPIVIYQNPGTYTVSLTINGTETKTETDYITISLPQCTSNDWQSQDGECQENNTLTRTWEKTGNCEGGITKPNSETIDCIYQSPITSNFTAEPTSTQPNQPIQFTNNSTGTNENSTYLWDFGDGNTSTLKNPTHSYESTGAYTVSLTINETETKTETGYINITETIFPKITLITTTVENNSTFKEGQTIPISITFSEEITSQGLTLNLSSNGNCETEPITTPSTTTSCTYQVGSEENTDLLRVLTITGSIEDSDENEVSSFTISTGMNELSSKNIRIDTQVPEYTISIENNSTTITGTEKISINTNDQDISETKCRINNTNWQTCSNNDSFNSLTAFENLAPGETFYLEVMLKDTTGNETVKEIYSLTKKVEEDTTEEDTTDEEDTTNDSTTDDTTTDDDSTTTDTTDTTTTTTTTDTDSSTDTTTDTTTETTEESDTTTDSSSTTSDTEDEEDEDSEEKDEDEDDEETTLREELAFKEQIKQEIKQQQEEESETTEEKTETITEEETTTTKDSKLTLRKELMNLNLLKSRRPCRSSDWYFKESWDNIKCIEGIQTKEALKKNCKGEMNKPDPETRTCELEEEKIKIGPLPPVSKSDSLLFLLLFGPTMIASGFF